MAPDRELTGGSPVRPKDARGRAVRYRVLAFTVALAGITYLDRVCIAQTAQDVMRDLSLSTRQMSFVFSAFTIAYAIFEVPTGAWGDRIGARRLLTRIVIWWSSFTIATAAAFNFTSLLAVRFLFGAGEAGAFPNVSKTFSRWFPATERGTAQGIFFAGAHLGGGLTPLLVLALLHVLSWRMVFVVFGAIGFVWAAAWFVWFRDDPAEHSEVSAAELALITGPEAGYTPSPGRRDASPCYDRSKHDCIISYVFYSGVRILFQYHLATDILEPGARLFVD